MLFMNIRSFRFLNQCYSKDVIMFSVCILTTITVVIIIIMIIKIIMIMIERYLLTS